MVTLCYELSPEWNRDQPGLDLSLAGEVALRYDLFLGDVVFTIDGADLSARWGWVPVLDFALSLRFALRSLERDGTASLEFTESDERILIERSGDALRLTATYAPFAAATVARAELEEAADRFLERLVDDLCARHPELGVNPVFTALLA